MINRRDDFSEQLRAIIEHVRIRAEFNFRDHEGYQQSLIYISGFVQRRVVQRFSFGRNKDGGKSTCSRQKIEYKKQQKNKIK